MLPVLCAPWNNMDTHSILLFPATELFFSFVLCRLTGIFLLALLALS